MPNDVFGLNTVYDRQVDSTWIESENYGYFVGGYAQSASDRVCTIDRIDFSSETVSLPGPSLTEKRNVLTGLSSPDYGYFAGGYTPPGYVCTIDRIDFSSETVSLPGSSLTHNKNGLGAVSSSNYGYFSGGFHSPPNSFFFGTDRIDFSSETVAGPPIHGLNLSQSRNGIAGVFNSDDGYFGGGRTPTSACTIDRIDFSSETAVAPGTYQLTQARYYLGSVSSSNYGYFAGGFAGPVVDTIDRIDFSNETTSTPGNDLTEAKEAVSGVFSSNYGYFGGGLNADPAYIATIDRIDFYNETISLPGNNLTQGRGYLGAVSGGKSVNSKGIRKGSDKDGKGISNTYGYFVAGGTPDNPGYTCLIDRLDFSTETTSEPGNGLSTRLMTFGAVSNPNYAHFGAGYNGTDNVNNVESMDFSNETTTSPTATLSQSKSELSAVFSSNYGYFAGGAIPSGKLDTIERIDFSNNTISLPGNNLTESRQGLTGVSNSSYGYLAGGQELPSGSSVRSTIDRIDFSTETVVGPPIHGADLSEARGRAAADCDSDYCYFAGGSESPTSYLATIDRLDFSNDTMSLPGNNLSRVKEDLASVSNSYYAYFGGGNGTFGDYNDLDRLEFSTTTVVGPSGHSKTLSKDRDLHRGVSN